MKINGDEFKDGRLVLKDPPPEESLARIRAATRQCDLAKLEAECRTTRDTLNQQKSLKQP